MSDLVFVWVQNPRGKTGLPVKVVEPVFLDEHTAVIEASGVAVGAQVDEVRGMVLESNQRIPNTPSDEFAKALLRRIPVTDGGPPICEWRFERGVDGAQGNCLRVRLGENNRLVVWARFQGQTNWVISTAIDQLFVFERIPEEIALLACTPKIDLPDFLSETGFQRSQLRTSANGSYLIPVKVVESGTCKLTKIKAAISQNGNPPTSFSPFSPSATGITTIEVPGAKPGVNILFVLGDFQSSVGYPIQDIQASPYGAFFTVT
jgi:hypothetical protein